ncbi:MAG: J domain-containing protein [Alphaproteobacteria bacterium]|nr:J domain-containing protein [Alphaproteobacteria bacterium]
MPRRSTRKAPKTTLESFGESADGAARPCDVSGCEGEGVHRAPVSPEQLNSYHWFCLEHVREYNKAWNFCAGRSDDEIEALIREDIVGWRPTWPLGTQGGGFARARFDRLRDEFGLFGDDRRDARGGDDKSRRRANGRKMQSAVDEALDILDLSPPVTAAAVKAQYIILVKRHHPDANGGDKMAEERLKLINQAYETLKETLSP